MAVDPNAVIKLHKSGKCNVEIAKRLDINCLMCERLWRSSRRPETPLTDQGAEENGVPAPLTSSKTRGKSCDETLSPKLQNLGHRSRCEQIHHAPGIEGRFVGEALQDAASPGDDHVVMRAQKCMEIL